MSLNTVVRFMQYLYYNLMEKFWIIFGSYLFDCSTVSIIYYFTDLHYYCLKKELHQISFSAYLSLLAFLHLLWWSPLLSKEKKENVSKKCTRLPTALNLPVPIYTPRWRDELNCENNTSCPRTQHNVPGQDLNPAPQTRFGF